MTQIANATGNDLAAILLHRSTVLSLVMFLVGVIISGMHTLSILPHTVQVCTVTTVCTALSIRLYVSEKSRGV